MSTIIKSIGYYYPLPELKSDKEAEIYFKQFNFNDLSDIYNLTPFIISLYKNKWIPFKDIKDNWAWIKYIHNEEECDDTNIEISNLDFSNEYSNLQQLWKLDKTNINVHISSWNLKFFAIDWYNESDFPLIIKLYENI